MRQFAEGLSDAQAADGVRARIDWKYALALELTDPGCDASVLSEFRQRLLDGKAELLLFETMLTLFRERRLINAKGHQRTASTHVLAAQMGTDGCHLPCTIDEPAPPPGCGRSPPSRPCGRCGCSSSRRPPRANQCAGAARLICHQRRC